MDFFEIIDSNELTEQERLNEKEVITYNGHEIEVRTYIPFDEKLMLADAMILVFIINLYTTYHLLQHIFIQMMIRMIKISNVVYIFFSLNCCRPKSWPSLPTEAE